MLQQHQVESLFDIISREGIEEFEEFGTLYHNTKTPEDKIVFQDNGPDVKILAVGHTDYVKGYSNPPVITTPKISLDGTHVLARQLDDRLGVWIILHILPQLLQSKGYASYDILLTDQEESGNSTGYFFNPPGDKKYNWMFEFDRKGTDVVMYHYETDPLKKMLQKSGFKVGTGSFTDICMLDHLECVGFNFGCGYHGEHSEKCYADLRDTMQMINGFVDFYGQYNKVKFKKSKRRSHRLPRNSVVGTDNKYGTQWWDAGYRQHRNLGYVPPNPVTRGTLIGDPEHGDPDDTEVFMEDCYKFENDEQRALWLEWFNDKADTRTFDAFIESKGYAILDDLSIVYLGIEPQGSHKDPPRISDDGLDLTDAEIDDLMRYKGPKGKNIPVAKELT